MITFSSRYAAALLILCLVAAVPVYLHSSGQLRQDDCAFPEALNATLPIPGTRAGPADRNAAPGMISRSDGTIGWEVYDEPMRFAIRRSFYPVHLLNPPQRVADSFEADVSEVRFVPADGVEVPIHWAVDSTRPTLVFSAYTFVFRGSPRENPLLSLFRASPAQLVTGGRPFTLFVVGGAVPRGRLPEARQAAEDWLVAAWRHYDAVCNAEPAPR